MSTWTLTWEKNGDCQSLINVSSDHVEDMVRALAGQLKTMVTPDAVCRVWAGVRLGEPFKVPVGDVWVAVRPTV